MGAGVVQKSGDNGRRRRGRGRSRPMAEINVTPFVDVMLVLLIIFMVAAPLMTVGFEVELPTAEGDALAAESEEPLVVFIQSDGRISLQTTEMELSELPGRLLAVAAERDSNRVFLRADGSVSYSYVAQIMEILSDNGFPNIGLVTQPGVQAEALEN